MPPACGSGRRAQTFVNHSLWVRPAEKMVERCFRRDAENNTPEAYAPQFPPSPADANFGIRVQSVAVCRCIPGGQLAFQWRSLSEVRRAALERSRRHQLRELRRIWGSPLPLGNSLGITARSQRQNMWFAKKHNPEEHRYYLLPGQGRSNRRKRRQQFVAALIAGAFFAAVIGAVMWFMNNLR
ncbi:MAG TPA: hypothetical protein PLX89_21950 [Verrucomicrobiota bacterium]|nr:hypothetical protein [Verrucomicrobiota bacterium]